MSKNSLYETIEDFVKSHPLYRREGKFIDIDDLLDGNIRNDELVELFEELYSHILD